MPNKTHFPVCNYPIMEQVKTAWVAMNTDAKIEHNLLRPFIAASWKRCQTQPLDPCLPATTPSLAPDEILESNQMLLDTAVPHMQKLYNLLGNRGYMIMLLCTEGYILNLFGDRPMIRLAEKLNVFPGAMQAEDSIGTFAPGICYAERQPTQVLRFEHYRETYHDWCCSATPICDTEGGIIGVLDITSCGNTPHPPELLDLACLTASAIEAQAQIKSMQQTHKKVCTQLGNLMDLAVNPIIILDDADKITHANQEAIKILHKSNNEVLGQDINHLLPKHLKVQKTPLDKAGNTVLWSDTAETNTQATPLHLQDKYAPKVTKTSKIQQKTSKPDSAHNSLYKFADIIHADKNMQNLLQEAWQMATSQYTILIQGESGTGKEMLAQAIHSSSSRADGPFIAVNCAAIAKDLVQSELFGYEGGAFTGASREGYVGKFEQAEGGTIFLDEIGDMPLDAQASLLRVIQEKTVVRIGGRRPKNLDVRILAATNKPLFQAVRKNFFRQDLYYRLSVIGLHIPPLRERPGDIPILVDHFMNKHLGKSTSPDSNGTLSLEVQQALLAYDWPGNARELENIIIRLVSKSSGRNITLADLPPHLRKEYPNAVPNKGKCTCSQKNKGELQSLERQAIFTALEKCHGRIGQAADMLGINRVTLYRKLKKYSHHTK